MESHTGGNRVWTSYLGLKNKRKNGKRKRLLWRGTHTDTFHWDFWSFFGEWKTKGGKNRRNKRESIKNGRNQPELVAEGENQTEKKWSQPLRSSFRRGHFRAEANMEAKPGGRNGRNQVERVAERKNRAKRFWKQNRGDEMGTTK